MSEGLKPTVNRRLVKESCFGTYVLSAKTFKSYMLTPAACEVVKIVDGKRTVADLVEQVGVSHNLNPGMARKRVNAVIDELRRMGALRLE
jgi:hypothetical protein